MPRFCTECDSQMIGRSDKRFCSDHCRVAYHNRKRKEAHSDITRIEKVLRANRRILHKNNPTGKAFIDRTDLLVQGFDPRYFTHQYTNRKGQVYNYVFDQGYIELEPGRYMLVVDRKPEQNEVRRAS